MYLGHSPPRTTLHYTTLQTHPYTTLHCTTHPYRESERVESEGERDRDREIERDREIAIDRDRERARDKWGVYVVCSVCTV